MAETTANVGSTQQKAVDFLKLPYMRAVVPEDDGSFRAEILEFPGCIATADKADEALRQLEEVAESWIEAKLEAGQTIPEPMEINDYSGKLVVRMPRSLHRKAALAAQLDGVSLNQLIVTAIASHLGSGKPERQSTADHFRSVAAALRQIEPWRAQITAWGPRVASGAEVKSSAAHQLVFYTHDRQPSKVSNA